jgi:hypothetical protein
LVSIYNLSLWDIHIFLRLVPKESPCIISEGHFAHHKTRDLPGDAFTVRLKTDAVEKTHKEGMASSVYEVKENQDKETLAGPVGEGFQTELPGPTG